MEDNKVVAQAFPVPSDSRIFLSAVGSNQPIGEFSPIEVVTRGIRQLALRLGIGLRRSRLFATPCVPEGTGPDYVNAAVLGVLPDGLAETDLLAALHDIEARFDRTRQGRWAARTLDLDLVAVGDAVRPDAETQDGWRALTEARQRTEAPAELILPHPRMQDRAFVLVPLADIAPTWRHPRLERTVAEMLSDLPHADVAAVIPLAGHDICLVSPGDSP